MLFGLGSPYAWGQVDFLWRIDNMSRLSLRWCIRRSSHFSLFVCFYISVIIIIIIFLFLCLGSGRHFVYVICLEYHYVGVLALVCLFALFVLSFVFTFQFHYFRYHHHHYLFFPFCYAKSSCFSPLCSFLGFHKRSTRYVLPGDQSERRSQCGQR